MLLAEIIYNLSLFIWLIPPIRQYRGDYFYFFLILALLDPVGYVLLKGIDIPFYSTYSFGGLLSIVSLTGLSKVKTYISLLAFCLLIFLNVNPLFNLRILIIVEYLIVVLIIQKRAIQYYFTWEKFNLFHLILLFYIITIITKFMFLLMNIKAGLIYFYITSLFEIITALYFCIVKGQEKRGVTVYSESSLNFK